MRQGEDHEQLDSHQDHGAFLGPSHLDLVRFRRPEHDVGARARRRLINGRLVDKPRWQRRFGGLAICFTQRSSNDEALGWLRLDALLGS